jgi:hypothetical protein
MMTDFGFSGYDLDTPSGRQSALKSVAPNRDSARKHHPALLDLFQREMTFRKDDGVGEALPCGEGEIDYFEHIYWCAFLLFLVGDPADIPLMWAAKQANMDTACGFDSQFLVGAGLDSTTEYLNDNDQPEIAAYIDNLRNYGFFDDLVGWEKFRMQYFYPTEAR